MIRQVLDNLLNNMDTYLNKNNTQKLDELSVTYQRLKSVTSSNVEDEELVNLVLHKILKEIDQDYTKDHDCLSKAYQRIKSVSTINQQLGEKA